jgi:hypothetical protein
MKRRVAASAAACLVLAIVALAILIQPRNASSQNATGHEHHDQAADQAAMAENPTAAGDGKTASLPGVPPGKPAVGGGVTTTITGEVMDPACFLEAGPKSIGKGHFQCAVDCAKSGQTLAIYDRALDRIYFVAGELPGRNPNDPLMRYIHQKVDVLGTVYHRSQAWGIVIIKVTPHKEKPAAPAKPAAPKAGAR